jgi:hypothetical protein
MRARKKMQRESLTVKAIYSIAELARIASVTRQLLGRLLHANRVEFIHSGRSVFVPLSEIEKKIPPLFVSLLSAETLQKLAQERARRSPERVRPGPSRNWTSQG